MATNYTFPHDNYTIVNESQAATTSTVDYSTTQNCLLMGFVSPKGQDGEFVLLTDEIDAINTFGTPNYNKYGQSYYQVINWLNGGGTVRGIRLTARDASYANQVLSAVICYQKAQATNSSGAPLYINPSGGTTTSSTSGSTSLSPYYVVNMSVSYVIEALTPETDISGGYIVDWDSSDTSDVNGNVPTSTGSGNGTTGGSNSTSASFGFNLSSTTTTNTPSTSTTSTSNSNSSSSQSQSSSSTTSSPSSTASSKDTTSSNIDTNSTTDTDNSSNVIESFYGLGSIDKNYLTSLLPDVVRINQTLTATSGTKSTTINVQKIPLFVVAVTGKGEYGNSYSLSLTPNQTLNNNSSYANYTLDITNDEGTNIAGFNVCLYPGAVNSDGSSLFIDDVVLENDLPVVLYSYDNAFSYISQMIANGMNQDNNVPIYSSDNNYENMDILFGPTETFTSNTTFVTWNTVNQLAMNEISSSIEGSNDVLTVVNPSSVMPFGGGSDGQFTYKTPTITSTFELSGDSLSENPYAYDARETELSELGTRWQYIYQAYYDLYSGASYIADGAIINPDLVPANFLMDANFPTSVKLALRSCGDERNSAPVILDAGIIETVSAGESYASDNILTTNNYGGEVFGQSGYVVDPYSGKQILVTFPYLYSASLPSHISNNGSYIPLAGSAYSMSGFIAGTLQPRLVTNEQKQSWSNVCLNYAHQTSTGNTIIDTIYTYQTTNNELSEVNNVFTLYQILDTLRQLVPTFRYKFTTASENKLFSSELTEALKPFTYKACSSLTVTVTDSALGNGLDISLNVGFNSVDLVNNVVIYVE